MTLSPLVYSAQNSQERLDLVHSDTKNVEKEKN